jgi:flagellar hook assembly protein FlgD
MYDVLGRQIRVLFDDVVTPGEQSLQWDGKDSKGISVSSGVYFYQLKSNNDFISTKKMILVK